MSEVHLRVAKLIFTSLSVMPYSLHFLALSSKYKSKGTNVSMVASECCETLKHVLVSFC